MGYLVRTVTALELRLGDIVIPDHGLHQRVTLHRVQGAHPVVAVQFAGIPGATSYYPPNLPILLEEPTEKSAAGRSGSWS
jgi:hypothetical protein